MVTIGVQWEAAGATSFGAQFLSNAWIAAVFAASIATLIQVQKRFGDESLAWGLGLSLLLALGALTDFMV